ncbi:MAG: 3-oxoacyl-ACP reductase FabG [Acidiferrobacterales bacterium]|nr:3-oxoacyl-ACP reductase FabG [Acidiferrobacterales bacterium]
MSKLLDSKICLVTGASRGIGKAVAIALGEAGATVIGTATSDGGAAAISNYLGEAGLSGTGKTLNVTVSESVDELMKSVSEEFGAPLVLVNNAGITRDNLLMRMKEEDWDDVMDTNLKSAYRMSKACLRPMTKAREGRIINIASVVGATGNPGQSNYSASKAGLMGFSKALAQEVASRNITVNVVAPGFIQTDMTDALTDDQKQQLLTKIPLTRLGQPQDIAKAVVFLASSMADYITGTTIHVNGGMYMS